MRDDHAREGRRPAALDGLVGDPVRERRGLARVRARRGSRGRPAGAATRSASRGSAGRPSRTPAGDAPRAASRATSAAAPVPSAAVRSILMPSLPSWMLPIRSWKTATTAAPAPRKTSASASASDRREGTGARVVRTTRRHPVRRPRGRVRVDRRHGAGDRAAARPRGGSQIRQTADPDQHARERDRTSGTRFAPVQPAAPVQYGHGRLYAN